MKTKPFLRAREEELQDAKRQRDGINDELNQETAKISMARESTKERTQTMKG